LAENSSNLIINRLTYKPDENPFGKTWEEWTADWWKWSLSLPKGQNPITDITGENASYNQRGPVWFLAGTFGGLAERTCDIPAGKSIMFPVINGECSYAEYPDLRTESELRSCAVSSNEGVTELMVTIDGQAIDESQLRSYRVESPLFNLTLPENNIFGLPDSTTQAVSDGFWVFLSPLEPGQHEIHYRGAIVDFTTESQNNFVTESLYRIRVV
jgi:hypothetical protein